MRGTHAQTGSVMMRRFRRKYGTSSVEDQVMSRIGTMCSILEWIERFNTQDWNPVLAATYSCYGGGERSNTSPLGASSTSSA